MLGTGTSHGVPMIGCDCRTCQSTDSRDRRSRPSILIERTDPATGSPFQQSVRHILVDTSTDLRAQALALNLRRVDAILFTHSHADHILGLDEVRRFNVIQKSAIPAYGDARTVADLRQTFSLHLRRGNAAGRRNSEALVVDDRGTILAGRHRHRPRPGDARQATDSRLPHRLLRVSDRLQCIPDTSWPLLEGVRTLVLDALRDRPHSTHFSVAEAVDAAARIGAGRTYFTHICHDLPHAETCARLPRGVELAYDGQVLEIRRERIAAEHATTEDTEDTEIRFGSLAGCVLRCSASSFTMDVIHFPEDRRPVSVVASGSRARQFRRRSPGPPQDPRSRAPRGVRAGVDIGGHDLRPASAAHRPARQGAAAADDNGTAARSD